MPEHGFDGFIKAWYVKTVRPVKIGEEFFLAYGGGYWSAVKAYHKNGNRPLDKFIHTALKYVTKKNNKDPTAIKLKKRLQKLRINQE